MNKSQELEVMVTRAEIHADEVMAKYETAWYGAEAKEVQPVEPVEQIEEGEDA